LQEFGEGPLIKRLRRSQIFIACAGNLPMVVPHGLRTRATSLEVIERVLRGEIGELRSIEIQCEKWDLLNAGIHWLDFCLRKLS